MVHYSEGSAGTVAERDVCGVEVAGVRGTESDQPRFCLSGDCGVLFDFTIYDQCAVFPGIFCKSAE